MTMQQHDKRTSPMHMEDHRNLSNKNIKRMDPSYNSNTLLDKRGMSTEKFSILKPND